MADCEEFLGAVKRSRKLHRGWVSPPSTEKTFRELLTRAKKDDFCSFLICRKDTRAIAGIVNISRIFYGPFRSAYLGFYVFEGYQAQGLMREGLRLVLRVAFRRLKLHRLEANIQPENRRSAALVKSLGFQLEGFSPKYLKVGGRWRDHNRWAILRDEL
jgi:[ribosomal protein S5]-alanine N-acetyltransferase